MSVIESNLPVGDTKEKLDTTTVTQTDGTVVHREAVVITDPEILAARAKVRKGSDQEYRIATDLPPNIIGELRGLGERLDRIEFLLEGLAS